MVLGAVCVALITDRQIPSNIWAPDSTVAQLSAAVVAAVAR